MILKESKLLRESVEQYLILESRQILLENIKNDPKKYFVINEHYKQYCTEEEWKVIEEGIWDTITGVASSIGDYFKENPRQGIQAVADIVSIFDPTGIVDLVNGIFYYYFKDYFSAFFSFLGASLTMGGLILGVVTSGTGVGIAAGAALEATGKAVQISKTLIKAGKPASIGMKELGTTIKAAMPAIKNVGKLVENVPIINGVSKWFVKSADNIVTVTAKEGSTMADVSKAVGSTSTEMANNPVVKGFTEKVVDAVKSQGLKPSMLQTGFAALGAYGVWMQADEASLRKVAIAQLADAFQKEGIQFDPNSKNAEFYINSTIKKLDKERRNCKSEEECKTNFQKLGEKYPSVLKALEGLKKFGDYGADLIKPSNA